MAPLRWDAERGSKVMSDDTRIKTKFRPYDVTQSSERRD